MVATFDTLRTARRLKEAGAPEPVAEAIAEALRESRDFDLSQLATKADLAALRGELLARIGALPAEMLDVKADILRWVVGLPIAQAALIVTLVRPVGHP